MFSIEVRNTGSFSVTYFVCFTLSFSNIIFPKSFIQRAGIVIKLMKCCSLNLFVTTFVYKQLDLKNNQINVDGTWHKWSCQGSDQFCSTWHLTLAWELVLNNWTFTLIAVCARMERVSISYHCFSWTCLFVYRSCMAHLQLRSFRTLWGGGGGLCGWYTFHCQRPLLGAVRCRFSPTIF